MADLDLYSPILGPVDRTVVRLAPTWHGPAWTRRWAYQHAIHALCSATYPDGETDPERRGYGDAEALVAAVVDGVLGDHPGITVPGADTPPPAVPALPDLPDPLPDDADDAERRVHEVLTANATAARVEAVAAWEAALAAHPTLLDVQDRARAWATSEHWTTKLRAAVTDACRYGDGILTLTWSDDANRPVVRLFDPGSYFPVLAEDSDETGMPERVHLAWEWADGPERYVTRITYELTGWTDDETGTPQPVDRPAPWNPDVDQTATCLWTEATWRIADVAGVDDLDLGKAVEVVADHVDLGIDWIPVYHLRGPGPDAEHFGTSVLAPVYHALLDLAEVDHDVLIGGRLVAAPAWWYSGARPLPDSIKFAPGVGLGLGEKGTAGTIDLSSGLPVLLDGRDRLLARIRANARVPGEVLGATDSTDAVSGAAMYLSAGRYLALVDAIRGRVAPVLDLLLKHVARWWRLNGDLEPGPDVHPRVTFGAALPADVDAEVRRIIELVKAGILSVPAAVTRLAALGVTGVTDVDVEVAAIRADDPAAAALIVEATGNVAAAAERLGVEPAALDVPVDPA